MSDDDFEAYLSLLSRFLRLKPQQREEIRRELRAHLEDALEDEQAGGVSRNEVLLHVLEDFGDAAELAARFSKLERRRRWLMQGTMAAASIGFVVLSLSFFTTDSTAPTGLAPAGTQAEDRGTTLPEAPENERIRQALETNLESVAFDEAPFDQVIDWLGSLMDIDNLHVQWQRLEEEGIARDTPMSLSLRNVTAKRVLRMLLDEFGDVLVDYKIQDGVLVISTPDAFRRRMTTEVYDVRDILAMIEKDYAEQVASGNIFGGGFKPSGGGRAGGGSSGSATVPSGGAGNAPLASAGRIVANASGVKTVGEIAQEELVRLLTNAVEPDSWVDNGGQGYQQILSGLLVVRQYDAAHADIRTLLSDLRAASPAEVP